MKSKLILTLMLFVLSSFAVIAGSGVIDNISLALKSGNSRELARYFDTNVELTILDDEAAYSKEQAEQVVKAFFEKNKPTNYELVHKGSSETGSQYCIGNVSTTQGTYRTYLYLKQKGDSFYIQTLSFEKD